MKFSIENIPFLLFLFIFWSCANIVPPNGGPVDTTPPEIISLNPKDSLLNTRVSRIELRFDKFVQIMDLNKNLQVSPLMEVNPEVVAIGKKVVVRIADSLIEDATTYRISLGDAIVDNRENTKLGNFDFTFSTTGYFDSLSLKGKITDALSGKADTNMLIMLYNEKDSDSAFIQKKPRYITKIQSDGQFEFRSLPERAFKIYALYDANNNFKYDYGQEKIGFLNHTVLANLDTTPSNIEIFTFAEQIPQYIGGRIKAGDTLIFKKIPAPGNYLIVDSLNLDSLKLLYQDDVILPEKKSKPNFGTRSKSAANQKSYEVFIDTTDIQKATQELTEPIKLVIYQTISNLDTNKVYLSYLSNEVEVEAMRHLEKDSAQYLIKTDWLPEKTYTLRLVKGWATDTSGNELMPSKYTFKTKSVLDYGQLNIIIPDSLVGDTQILWVQNNNGDTIYHKSIKENNIRLKNLKPDTYQMKIIIDENNNGKWDAGNLFKKQQPEKILFYFDPIILKAGWNNDIDFSTINKKPKLGTQDSKTE